MGNKNNNKEKGSKNIEYIYDIPDLDKSKLKTEYKIVFIGESGVGAKSNLINILSGLKYDEYYPSTTSASFSEIKIKLKQKKDIAFNLWDTIGQKSFRQLTKIFLKDIDCAVIGYDITDRETFDEAKYYWYKTIKDEFQTCKLICFIGNKKDVEERRAVEKEEATDFAESNNLRFFEISCKTGEGIKEFLDDLVYNLLKQ